MKAKRIIALFLALIAVFSLCSMQSLAATADNVRQYGKEGGYLAIGDSISRGVGALSIEECNDPELRNVAGSFTYLVAQAVGCTCPEKFSEPGATYWPCCFNGTGVAAMMDLMGIEDNYYDIEYVHHPADDTFFNRYATQLVPCFGCPESVDGNGCDGVAGNIRDLVSKASLITVQLGMQELLNRPYTIADAEGYLSDENRSAVGGVAAYAGRLVSELYEGFDYWVKYYPVFIQTLKEMNPDATIVLVSAFNIVADVDILDGIPSPVGTVIGAIPMLMNRYYRQWAKEFDCIYVDVTNAETASTTYDWAVMGDEFMPNDALATHPTREGHAYIARQILAALESETPIAPYDTAKNIVVDLERFTNVNYVMLDNEVVKNYSLDGYDLIVPVEGRSPKTLTVAVVQEDGKIAVTTYHLVYDNGYVAYRMYGLNDTFGYMSNTLSTILNAVRSFFSFFKLG